MNKVLKNFINIWSDLEVSFENSQKSDRVEYLKSIIIYDEDKGTHMLNFLLTKVNEMLVNGEVPQEVETLITIIIEMLKDLSNYIDVNGVPNEIDNLNNFIATEVRVTEDEFTVDDLNKLLEPDSIKEVKEVPYSDMFKYHQAFSHAIVCTDIDNLRYTEFVGVPPEDGSILVMKPHEVYGYFFRYNSAKTKKDKSVYDPNVLSCIGVYSTKLDSDKVLAIVDKKYLEIDEEGVHLFDNIFKQYVSYSTNGKSILTFSSKGCEICSIL